MLFDQRSDREAGWLQVTEHQRNSQQYQNQAVDSVILPPGKGGVSRDAFATPREFGQLSLCWRLTEAAGRQHDDHRYH